MQSNFFVGEHLLFIAFVITQRQFEGTRLTEFLQIYVESTSEQLFSVFRYNIFLGLTQKVCMHKKHAFGKSLNAFFSFTALFQRFVGTLRTYLL